MNEANRNGVRELYLFSKDPGSSFECTLSGSDK